ncbi:Miniconductance mechanosensitive channel MscM precursor [Rubripirellula obstinata]|uniref:Miniconductance mechanosensitive channel MscM n=1 Tax=Rubripirellula obstinata TaxID=406547 RepID=A0A5B1CPX2_9BACT|nr:mechanosensitive ion channel domain-containing protein [Rubripirellula obstinata]KAA1262281.1 Miniconductance mechanosensitive channel MscM precursor [Rubripirellula obstinata]
MTRLLDSRIVPILLPAFIAIGFSLLAFTAAAQQLTLTPPLSDLGDVTLEDVEAQLAAVDGNSELDETQKASAKEILLKAKKSLEGAKAESEKAKQYKSDIASVPEQTKQINNKIETLDQVEVQIDESASTDALSQRLTSVKAELQDATEYAAKLAGEPTSRRPRLAEIPGLIAEVNRNISNVQEQLSQPPPANESPVESTTRKLYLQAQAKELRAAANRLVQEQAFYVATTELVPLEQKLTEAKVQRLNQELKLLQEAIVERQSKEARETTEALKKTTSDVPESLRGLAKSNLELAQKQAELISQSTQSKQSLANVQAAVAEVTTELKTSKARMDAVGLTDALGLMFRKRRQDFEELRFEFRPSDSLKQQIQKYQIDTFRLEDELNTIKRNLADSQSPSIDWESTEIQWDKLPEADAEWVLLKKRQKLIEDTTKKQNEELQTLLNKEVQQSELMREIDQYDNFVDRHLFWTRNAPAISFSELKVAPQTLGWITNPENWQAVGQQLQRTAMRGPLGCLALAVVLLGIWYARPSFRRTIISEGKEANRFSATFVSTIQTLSASVGASAAWPATFGFVAFLCLASSSGNPFVKGIGQGLAVTALFVASRTFLKEICRADGLADAHFGWSEQIRVHLRRHLRWYTLLGGISLFFLVLYNQHPDTLIRTFTTRISSTALFVITATFHHCILGNRSPLFPEVVRVNPDSFIYRWRKLIWVIAVGAPLLFGLMSLAGYLETTVRLGRSLQSSFFLLVFVVVVLGLLSRWLTLHRRNVARQNAAELRQRRLASVTDSDNTSVANEAGIVLEDETQMDLPTLDHQTRLTAFALAAIIGFFGLAFIWSDLVPALDYLDEITVKTIGTGEDVEIITLKDLVYVFLTVAAVFFAVRNLPSMLELLVLSRTKIDGGARYAISTLLRYVLIIVGALVVLDLLSLPYNQLGWLVAAASVGLGFGLQEIVANFVSGIILLLERPVRVGDVVTIDGTTGIVSRIQMRATTVTNWDRKELVIPNKDLITQKLLNWSLSNVVNRLTIEVGVAYGTDPNQVRQILSDVVTSHPDVLQDPPPLINFETFGDSSLNFVVRFFLPKLDNRIEVTHQVNTAIAEAFAKADISIPFPQRDVHFVKPPA